MSKYLLLSGIVAVLLLAGCKSGDGFKPADVQSKADIQKQIDNVNANSSLQPGQKAMVISNLEKKLKKATD
jgi:hypothetical protein